MQRNLSNASQTASESDTDSIMRTPAPRQRHSSPVDDVESDSESSEDSDEYSSSANDASPSPLRRSHHYQPHFADSSNDEQPLPPASESNENFLAEFPSRIRKKSPISPSHFTFSPRALREQVRTLPRTTFGIDSSVLALIVECLCLPL